MHELPGACAPGLERQSRRDSTPSNAKAALGGDPGYATWCASPQRLREGSKQVPFSLAVSEQVHNFFICLGPQAQGTLRAGSPLAAEKAAEKVLTCRALADWNPLGITKLKDFCGTTEAVSLQNTVESGFFSSL